MTATRGAAALFAILASACGSSPVLATGAESSASGASAWHYTIRYEPGNRDIDVRVCFDGPPPDALICNLRPITPNAASLDDGTELSVFPGEIAIRGAGDRTNVCVRYAVPLAQAMPTGGCGNVVGWLFRPRRFARNVRVTATFEMPMGMRVAVPWRQTGEASYAIDSSTFRFAGYGAIGNVDTEEIEAAGARIRLHLLEPETFQSRALLLEHAATSAQTVATLFGRFPSDTLDVCVVPSPGNATHDAIRFGLLGTGGANPSATLFVRPNADAAAFARGWVAVHEFSHLALPEVPRRDRWLSEGVTTYHQEILPVRANRRPPREGWRRLFEGFSHGRERGTGRTLADESRDMFQTRAFQRVYWAGAALALMIDVELRRQSEGRHSLPSALRTLSGEWERRAYRAEEIVAAIDRVTNTTVATQIVGRSLHSTDFPDLHPTCVALALSSDGAIHGANSLREALSSPTMH